MSRMHKLGTRLGGSASVLEPFPPRPRYAPSHVPNATGTLYVAVATEHGGSAGICVSTQAADRRNDVSTGMRDCADRGRSHLCRPLLREQETRERGLIRHAFWSVFDPNIRS
jgi:hypothetical protein